MPQAIEKAVILSERNELDARDFASGTDDLGMIQESETLEDIDVTNEQSKGLLNFMNNYRKLSRMGQHLPGDHEDAQGLADGCVRA